jgi:hypothetical protein
MSPQANYTRQETLDTLDRILANYLFGVYMLEHFPTSGWLEAKGTSLAFLGLGLGLSHDLWAGKGSDPLERKSVKQFFEATLRRALSGEGHEIVDHYCEVSNQDFMTWDHYWFSMVVRNCVSHKRSEFIWWPKKRHHYIPDTAPIIWRHLTITKDMNGKTPLMMSNEDAVQLHIELRDFVDKKLA